MDKDDSRPLTRDLAPFGVRMPPELKARIQAAAEASNRSMNAEIIYRLQMTFEMDDYVPKENVHTDSPELLLSADLTEIVARQNVLIEKQADLMRQLLHRLASSPIPEVE